MFCVRSRVAVSAFLLVGGAALLGASAFAGGESSAVRNGGTFRIALIGNQVDYIDPALSYSFEGWALLDTTCARLMRYPDKPSPAGFRLQPDAAASYPRVTNNAKTFTFRIRPRLRFSNGARVTASAFARAINRTMAPVLESAGAQYTQDIDAVLAKGNRLVVKLKHPRPDFPARTTMPFFCAVPPTLPVDPEGLKTFPAAGPYYVAEYVPGQRVVLSRNRFYRGTRPHHVDRFVVDLRLRTGKEVLDRIEQGGADWGLAPPRDYYDPARRLVAKYGINKLQFFLRPGLGFRGFAFNTARGVFRNNPQLRRAVNFAVDRPAFVRAVGSPLASHVTDQYLPPGIAGFRDSDIYPLKRPNLPKARALARGHTKGGKVVAYIPNFRPTVVQAQILKQNLQEIGLDVEIKPFPFPVFRARVTTPGEPWDIAEQGWAPDYVDPYAYINLLLDGRFAGDPNVGRFDSARYNGLMRRAARLRGSARYQAYGKLDVQLARDAAPMIAIAFENVPTLVSKRVDRRCIVLRPTLDLTAVCLK